mgnify:CR=1 FL=1
MSTGFQWLWSNSRHFVHICFGFGGQEGSGSIQVWSSPHWENHWANTSGHEGDIFSRNGQVSWQMEKGIACLWQHLLSITANLLSHHRPCCNVHQSGCKEGRMRGNHIHSSEHQKRIHQRAQRFFGTCTIVFCDWISCVPLRVTTIGTPYTKRAPPDILHNTLDAGVLGVLAQLSTYTTT